MHCRLCELHLSLWGFKENPEILNPEPFMNAKSTQQSGGDIHGNPCAGIDVVHFWPRRYLYVGIGAQGFGQF